jgi:hypothetical protein
MWGRGTDRRSSVVETEEDKGTRRWGDKEMDRKSSVVETEEDKGTRRWGDKGKMKSEK